MQAKPESNQEFKYLLVGNPNCGKSTLFNRLTGLRQKTGNFTGVTVEKKIGSISLNRNSKVEIWDLPGAYSLDGISEDKKVTTREILNRNEEDRIIFVLDAIQLERSLQFLTSIIDTGAPLVVVLTMKDLLARRGISIDTKKLETMLGVPVFFINAKSGEGVEAVNEALKNPASFRVGNRIWDWASQEKKAVDALSKKTTCYRTFGKIQFGTSINRKGGFPWTLV